MNSALYFGLLMIVLAGSFAGLQTQLRKVQLAQSRIESKLNTVLSELGVMPTPASDPRMARIMELAQQGKKIQAIKEYREITGTGLKEAKDAVEALHPPM